MKRNVGVTLGEPAGIGPELVARSMAEFQPERVHFRIYGSPNLFEKWMSRLHLRPQSTFEVVPCGPDPAGGEFRSQEERADAVLATLDRASKEALDKTVDAIVTAPIDKSIVRSRDPGFTGHTEYLARRAGVAKTVMLMDNTEIRVILLTEHIPLRKVSTTVTAELVRTVCRISVKAFRDSFGIENPRIAVAGINPHAGEIVENAEEGRVLLPAITSLQKEGILIEGPFAADSIFPLSRSGGYDLVLSPYHDQGLVAVKYPGLNKVVNVTLGLPYLRVSPGHGVAYAIVGKKPADPGSFERALRIAIAGSLVP